MQLVQQFADLFEGNDTAIGTEEGGCERYGEGHPDLSGQFRWDVENHLRGIRPPIGVYPMKYVLGLWLVKWGCIDYDEGEEQSWDHAKRTHALLKAFGATSWIERSRSKGYHVWVFARSWVPARTMRLALLVCAEGAGAPTKEVNPKQVSLKPEQLGNYVRLPYPGHLRNAYEMQDAMDLGLVDVTRRVAINPTNKLSIQLTSFVKAAYESRVSPEDLDRIAGYYKPPERPIRRRDWSGLPRTSEGISGFVKWVAQLPEGNRNMGLYWAARECLDQGVTELEPLVEAAVTAGLSEWEARRTIESALKG